MALTYEISVALGIGRASVIGVKTNDGIEFRFNDIKPILETVLSGFRVSDSNQFSGSGSLTLLSDYKAAEIKIPAANPELTILIWKEKEEIYVVLSLQVNASLSSIPVLGPFLGSGKCQLENIILTLATEQYTISSSSSINKWSTLNSLFFSSSTPQSDWQFDLPKGLGCSATFLIDGQTLSLPAPRSVAQESSQPVKPQAEAAKASERSNQITPDVAGVKWVSVQRALGPVHINRIGYQWLAKTQEIQGLIDADLTTSAVGIKLSGLSISLPLSNFSDIEVSLIGLDVRFSSPTVSIEGGLVHTPVQNGSDRSDEYAGSLLVTAANFSLMAIAAFKRHQPQNQEALYSLFAFALLQRELGGPPAFRVSAISVGFGYSQHLTAPTIDAVESFPLLTLNSENLQSAYVEMKQHITEMAGEYWIAAGIRFRSFEHINSNVIAILEVGKELEVLILGQSSAYFPAKAVKPYEPYGYIELNLELVLQPAQGIFRAEALLSSNSYLLDPSCHLSGGFAFYSWFGSHANTGDFVFTVGGYHPSFQPPAHYPIVPRLGFNWVVSDHVTIKGGAYFAMTPACVMAGGSLEVVYQDGNLRAWLTAYADLLIWWQPFHFEADISIVMGVSYAVHFWFINTTLRFELGATLNLYGPPTGGVVHIHLWIISFSVSFGAQRQERNPIKADQFLELVESGSSQDQSKICHITVRSGLINQVPDGTQQRWIVRAGSFSFDVLSAIPVASVSLNSTTEVHKEYPVFIVPMSCQLETSALSVEVVKIVSESKRQFIPCTYSSATRNLPTALWNRSQSSNQPRAAADLMKATVGLEQVAPSALDNKAQQTGIIDAQVAFQHAELPNGLLPIGAADQAITLNTATRSSAAIDAQKRDAALRAIEKLNLTGSLQPLASKEDENQGDAHG